MEGTDGGLRKSRRDQELGRLWWGLRETFDWRWTRGESIGLGGEPRRLFSRHLTGKGVVGRGWGDSSLELV